MFHKLKLFLLKTYGLKVLFSKRRLIDCVKWAYEKSWYYNELLFNLNISPLDLHTLSDFKCLPILSKKEVFGEKFALHNICSDNKLPRNIKSIYTSSGFSGVPSYGIVTSKDTKRQSKELDFLLDYLYPGKSPFIINAEHMGVSIFSSHPVLTTGLRPDIIVNIIREVYQYYDYCMIVCDPHFAKKLVEDGEKYGLNWRNYSILLVIGGNWVPYNYVKYLHKKLRCNSHNKSQVRMSMGLSEFGLNLAHDLFDLQRIREYIGDNIDLREKLFGDLKFVPELLYLYSNRVYLEIINQDKNGFGECVFSDMSFSSVPLIRYNSFDIGKIFEYKNFAEIINTHRFDSLAFKLPIFALLGRREDSIGENVNIHHIEECLYRDINIIPKITGMWKIKQEDDELCLHIQLKENCVVRESLLEDLLKRELEQNIEVKWYSYQEFPFGIELDYERKFNFKT